MEGEWGEKGRRKGWGLVDCESSRRGNVPSSQLSVKVEKAKETENFRDKVSQIRLSVDFRSTSENWEKERQRERRRRLSKAYEIEPRLPFSFSYFFFILHGIAYFSSSRPVEKLLMNALVPLDDSFWILTYWHLKVLRQKLKSRRFTFFRTGIFYLHLFKKIFDFLGELFFFLKVENHVEISHG